MVLKYVVAIAPTLLEDMVVKIWEVQSDGPGAEVDTILIPERNGAGIPTVGAGHQVPFIVISTGLDLVTHIVRLFTISGTQLHQYTEEGKVNGVIIFDPIRFKIGDGNLYTPVVNTNTYTNPALQDLEKDDFLIMRNQYGLLFPDIHYEITPADAQWNLLTDDVFGENEEFTILQRNKSSENVVNDSVVAKIFGGFLDVVADIDYIAAHLRKLVRFESANLTYTFPLATSVPIGYSHTFQYFGTGVTSDVCTIEFLNSELLWNGANKTSIDIPLLCEACFTFDGTNWNVVYISQSTFIEDDNIPQGKTIGTGTLIVGNIARAGTESEVVHAGSIPGDYNVFLSIRGTAATQNADTNIIVSWRHHATDKPNRFIVCTREPENVASVNNATICWLIIKN